MLTRRQAGVLLHPTSLPGRFGIGDLGNEASGFLHWLAAAGQRVWQILPLGPTGFGNSPYGALSAFAGNPLLISPDRLQRDGWLTERDLSSVPDWKEERVDFERVITWKMKLLRHAHDAFIKRNDAKQKTKFEAFRHAAEQHYWLDDFALFMALKDKHHGAEWTRWPATLVRRDGKAMEKARHDLAKEIELHQFAQFLFFEQWNELRAEAKNLGISILGDLPIYVAYDGADVWAHPELFQLDEQFHTTVVAGVPPDYFSAEGQRWGNPLYRWDRMKETKFAWWVERIKANLLLADLVRLDHFRGFAGYWAVPATETTAKNGSWLPGPGIDLFKAIEAALGSLPLIAEDLGTITPDVDALRKAIKAPGMRVLQFAFGSDDNIHLPHHCEENGVIYTGTHDNDTTRGWFDSAPEHEKNRTLTFLGSSAGEVPWQMVRAAHASVARIAIVPLQDLFGLGSEARMNTPGDSKGNWAWRAPMELFHKQDVIHGLRRLTEIAGRAN